jgi:hypothetical protein
MCLVSKNDIRLIALVIWTVMSIITFSVSAVTRYVNVYNSSPQAPYTNWATAAKVIQNALDASAADDIVIVTNGVYAMGGKADDTDTLVNRAYVPYRVSMFSLNGPERTIILGNGPVGPAAVRCAYLNVRSFLSGFTLSNGHTLTTGNDRSGGGVYGFGTISNCIVTCCASDNDGGGVNQVTVYNSTICNNRCNNTGGGTFRSSIYNSMVCNNVADSSGGGAMSILSDKKVISNCVFYSNTASNYGGGLYIGGTVVIDSYICDNIAHYGGGIHMQQNSKVSRCVIHSNAGVIKGSSFSLGGGVYCNNSGFINNCLVYRNKAEIIDQGGYGAGIYLKNGGTVRNSTIINNTLALEGGGVYAEDKGNVYNSIMYGNQGDNIEIDGTGVVVRFCCSRSMLPGDGNITNAPVFINAENDIFQHRYTSPCIDAGLNALTNTTGDIDGTDRVIGIVDMGCYEYVPEHTSAVYYYVSPDGNNQYPYTSSEWAARNIQDAVNAAQGGDIVRIAPGRYSSSFKFIRGLMCRIGLDKAVAVVADSDDPADTVVFGEPDYITRSFGSNAVRCAYLTNGAVLTGVTLRDGCTRNFGSSTYERSGAGALLDYGGVLSNCVCEHNTASRWGGGANCNEGGAVSFCILRNNSAQYGGGGRCYFNGLFDTCIITGNNAYRGGGAQVQNFGTVRNSLITENQVTEKGGGMHCYNGSVFENCTVCSNEAATQGGGVYCDSGGTNINMILYFNTAPDGANYFNDDDQAYYMYSCTTPPLSGLNNGPGNITGNPLFEDVAAGDFRLSSGSGCIDAGTNMPWMIGEHDLDGNPRIYDDTVDMGAYEFIPEPGISSFLLIMLCLACLKHNREKSRV